MLTTSNKIKVKTEAKGKTMYSRKDGWKIVVDVINDLFKFLGNMQKICSLKDITSQHTYKKEVN